MADDGRMEKNEFLFMQVVSMFQVAAMQQLGKIPNPLSNEIERDLEQAKVSIDILAALKEKTAGNLTKREEDFLGKVLFECQMNYVDELKKPDPAAAGRSGEGSEGRAGAEPGKGSEGADGGEREGGEAGGDADGRSEG